MSKSFDKLLLIIEYFIFRLPPGSNVVRKFDLLVEFDRKWRELDEKTISKNFYNLKAAGYIKFKKIDRDKMSLELTQKGVLRLIKAKNSFGDKRSDKVKSGKKMIFFDIPESKKKERNRLRFFLKELGFKEIQKSVFAGDYRCHEELKTIMEYLKIEKFVITGDFIPGR